MKNIQKRKTLITSIAVSRCLLLCAGTLGFVFLQGNENPSLGVFSTASSKEGIFIPCVMDGRTGEPIEGAKVVIPETGETYTTGKDGKTQAIAVPITRDERFDKMIQKPWGEISVLVYKDGYVPYALFYLELLAGETREGPEILMFHESDVSSGEPFSIIEGPNRTWVKAMIEKYQPAQ